MDLSFLDGSPNVTPILVRLYDSHKLYGLAKDKNPHARVELTSAVTELLEMKLSPRESELVADVLIGLIRQAEQDLKEAIAERLSIVDTVPLRLALQLANDKIDVARPMLKNSAVLGDLDLIYIIKSKSTGYWQAIAERKQMNEQVMNVLVDTGDIDTGIKLAQNKNITLSDYALGVLCDMARGSDALAQPLLRREEVDATLAAALYDYVGEELKTYITQTYPTHSAQMNEVVDEVVLDFVGAGDTQTQSEFYPSPQMLKAADQYKQRALLTEKLMLSALQRGQIDAFVAQFSRFCALEPQVVIDMLKQKNGQGLAVACKALGVDKASFVSMFLLTNRVRNEGAMVDIKDMSRAVEYYNRVEADVAMDIMKNTSQKKTTD